MISDCHKETTPHICKKCNKVKKARKQHMTRPTVILIYSFTLCHSFSLRVKIQKYQFTLRSTSLRYVEKVSRRPEVMHRFYSRIITHMAHVFIKVDIHHSLLIATLLHTGNFNSCFNLLIVKDTKIQTN